MNIFPGVMKLTQLVLLLILVTNVFGGYDVNFQKRAVSGGFGKHRMSLRDREMSLHPILNRHNHKMRTANDMGDYDDGEQGNGEEGNGDGDNGGGDNGGGDNGGGDNGGGDNGPGKCGLRYFYNSNDHSNANRIVGGEEAARGEFPWQVSIEMRENTGKSFLCGAVIISEFWILSAGHCFTHDKASDMLLTIGNHHLNRKDDGEQEFEVEQVIIHEKYNSNVYLDDYDIALVKIKPSANGQGIQFNKYAQPVCLPDASTSFPEGTQCVLAGWGRTSKDGPGSEVLLKTDSPITNHERCKAVYAQEGNMAVTERSICSGNVKGGNGACRGDSGGGLVCKTGDGYTLAGIVSAGRPCALPEYVTVFSLVPKFIPWIRTNVQRNSNFAQSMLPTAF